MKEGNGVAKQTGDGEMTVNLVMVQWTERLFPDLETLRSWLGELKKSNPDNLEVYCRHEGKPLYDYPHENMNTVRIFVKPIKPIGEI